MFELTIKDTVYQFSFNMGFLREINKTVTAPVEGMKDQTQNIGLRYKALSLYDNDLETLVEILDLANKYCDKPRVTRALLDAYIDDDTTDIDALFKDVIDFLSKANASKKTMEEVAEIVTMQRKKQERQIAQMMES